MPVKIADDLPAREILENEHIFVMSQYRALHQDIRPLKIVLLNLMPLKAITETQILRCLSNTPLQIEVDLMQIKSHVSKNTPQEHMIAFYKDFDELKTRNYDGLIITGAPVETLEYEEVEYWQELCDIMEWSKNHVHSTLHVCWGALAGLYYHYGIPKYNLPQKVSGIFKHRLITPKSRIFRGFDDEFYVPHSRNSEVREADILNDSRLKLMSVSDEAGVYLVGNQDGSQFFVMGHSEYDKNSLAEEYIRDIKKNLNPGMPKHYFENDDMTMPIVNRWRSHAHLLYTNWLNYFVYQTTPFVIDSCVKL